MKPRKHRGRRVPLPAGFTPVTRVNPTPAEVRDQISQPGLMILSYAHDAGCPALISQRTDDCRCDPDVQVLRYGEGQVRR